MLIDPYLSPNDILRTVAFCEKKGIKIRCITNIQTTAKNKEAKKEIVGEKDENFSSYEAIKLKFKTELEKGLRENNDMELTYRSVYENHGVKFHDRYLILKYEINKIRAWSLGASVNSVGKSHHIIQIVEAPVLIADFFDKVWCDTECNECKIYDSSDYNK